MGSSCIGFQTSGACSFTLYVREEGFEGGREGGGKGEG